MPFPLLLFLTLSTCCSPLRSVSFIFLVRSPELLFRLLLKHDQAEYSNNRKIDNQQGCDHLRYRLKR